MKERLIKVFNALRAVETKGDSTIIVADILRELNNIIQSLPEEKEGE